jgi:hypothetical protein
MIDNKDTKKMKMSVNCLKEVQPFGNLAGEFVNCSINEQKTASAPCCAPLEVD